MYKNIQTVKGKKFSIKKVLNHQTFRATLGFFVVFFAVLCSITMSGMSTKGYDIAELEKEITSLERENQKIDLRIAKYRSMQSIQDRLASLDLVDSDNVEYSTLVGSAVARR